MLTPAEFRRQTRGLPADMQEEIPEICWRCPYLLYLETICACPYYLCGYQLPDRLNQQTPPCLSPGV